MQVIISPAVALQHDVFHHTSIRMSDANDIIKIVAPVNICLPVCYLLILTHRNESVESETRHELLPLDRCEKIPATHKLLQMIRMDDTLLWFIAETLIHDGQHHLLMDCIKQLQEEPAVANRSLFEAGNSLVRTHDLLVEASRHLVNPFQLGHSPEPLQQTTHLLQFLNLIDGQFAVVDRPDSITIAVECLSASAL